MRLKLKLKLREYLVSLSSIPSNLNIDISHLNHVIVNDQLLIFNSPAKEEPSLCLEEPIIDWPIVHWSYPQMCLELPAISFGTQNGFGETIQIPDPMEPIFNVSGLCFLEEPCFIVSRSEFHFTELLIAPLQTSSINAFELFMVSEHFAACDLDTQTFDFNTVPLLAIEPRITESEFQFFTPNVLPIELHLQPFTIPSDEWKFEKLATFTGFSQLVLSEDIEFSSMLMVKPPILPHPDCFYPHICSANFSFPNETLKSPSNGWDVIANLELLFSINSVDLLRNILASFGAAKYTWKYSVHFDVTVQSHEESEVSESLFQNVQSKPPQIVNPPTKRKYSFIMDQSLYPELASSESNEELINVPNSSSDLFSATLAIDEFMLNRGVKSITPTLKKAPIEPIQPAPTSKKFTRMIHDICISIQPKEPHSYLASQFSICQPDLISAFGRLNVELVEISFPTSCIFVNANSCALISPISIILEPDFIMSIYWHIIKTKHVYLMFELPCDSKELKPYTFTPPIQDALAEIIALSIEVQTIGSTIKFGFSSNYTETATLIRLWAEDKGVMPLPEVIDQTKLFMFLQEYRMLNPYSSFLITERCGHTVFEKSVSELIQTMDQVCPQRLVNHSLPRNGSIVLSISERSRNLVRVNFVAIALPFQVTIIT
jgi:hypothetical protein